METAARTDGCDLLFGRNPGPPHLSEIHARGGRGRLCGSRGDLGPLPKHASPEQSTKADRRSRLCRGYREAHRGVSSAGAGLTGASRTGDGDAGEHSAGDWCGEAFAAAKRASANLPGRGRGTRDGRRALGRTRRDGRALAHVRRNGQNGRAAGVHGALWARCGARAR